jgi:DNA polymerase-3 subunit gamma/tau
MSHLVIARKFRPPNFASVIGQEHVCKILQNSIKRNRVAHAYLFAGPRGVGKTSLARIFSKALNCQNIKDFEPCLECSNCKEIAQGISLAVREIDGASHNSVENIRDLIDSFRAMPPPGCAYKVFIIDEVHMLSTAAFNALLKSLEEPPPNTVFILATTETHKIPDTVLSRCQRHEFRNLDISTINSALESILKAEGFQAEEGVTSLLARYAEGSLRDSQSLLERVIAYSSEEGLISLESVQSVLGVASRESIRNLWKFIREEDAGSALKTLKSIFSAGVDLTRSLKEFVEFIREDFNESAISRDAASILDNENLLVAATRGADLALRSVFGEALFEALVVKLALRKQRTRPLAVEVKPKSSAAVSSVADKSIASVGSASVMPAEVVKVLAPAEQQVLDWKNFLNSPEVKSQKILFEHLKRIAPSKFSNGNFEAKGPEFNISSLKREDILARFKELLAQFSGTKVSYWQVQLKVDETTSDSVHNQEKKMQAESSAKRSQQAVEHPAVKKLQQAFPGSRVSKAVVRD